MRSGLSVAVGRRGRVVVICRCKPTRHVCRPFLHSPSLAMRFLRPNGECRCDASSSADHSPHLMLHRSFAVRAQVPLGRSPPLYGSFFVAFGDVGAEGNANKLHRPAACVFAWDKGAIATHVCITDIGGRALQRAMSLVRDCPPLLDTAEPSSNCILWIANARLDYDSWLEVGKSQRESPAVCVEVCVRVWSASRCA